MRLVLSGFGFGGVWLFLLFRFKAALRGLLPFVGR